MYVGSDVSGVVQVLGMNFRACLMGYIFLFLFGGSIAFADELDRSEVYSAFLAAEYELALPELQRLAEEEDATATFLLGRSFYEGLGNPVNLEKAAEFFRKAAGLGDTNAPVWAGQALEALGSLSDAAAMHRLATERGPHLTSVLALARYHQFGFVEEPNRIATIRYSATADAILKRYDIEPRDYLVRFGCLELAQALFVEGQVASSVGGAEMTVAKMIELFTECAETGRKEPIKQILVDAVFSRLSLNQHAAIDESLTSRDVSVDSFPEDIRFVPYPFRGYVAFASDADSAETGASLSGQRFLNDHLGLPIASSVFPQFEQNRTSFRAREDGAASSSPPTQGITGFFRRFYDPDNKLSSGLPNAFNILRAWHRGRFDHFHSWYSGGRTLLLRPSLGQLSSSVGVGIDMSELARSARTIDSRQDRVVRMYFSQSLPEDVSVVFELKSGERIQVNTAYLQFSGRIEHDEDNTYFVVVLPFPAISPAFALPSAAAAVSLFDVQSLAIESGSCKELSCGTELIKIEVSVFDRAIAVEQARWLRNHNVFPYGMTSHGGELWDQFDDLSTLKERQQEFAQTTAEQDVVHTTSGVAVANARQTKGYLEDILDYLSVQMVRPMRMPIGFPPNDGIHDWTVEAPMYKLYDNQGVFSTTAFVRAAAAADSYLTQQEFVEQETPAYAHLMVDGCKTPNCGVEHASMLAFLVGASLEFAATTTDLVSHIWYTHFGAATQSFSPTVDEPFQLDAKAAFELLAEAHYGFDRAGDSTAQPRVLVRPSSTVLRARKLEYIAEAGLLSVATEGGETRISLGIDPFRSSQFPQEGHLTRDLAGLTIPVDDIDNAEILFVGDRVESVSRTLGTSGDRSGFLSIVDDETPTTLYGRNGEYPVSISLKNDTREMQNWSCVPAGDTQLFNVTHMSFEFSGKPMEFELSFMVRPHDQSAYGISNSSLKQILLSTEPETATGHPGSVGAVYSIVPGPVSEEGTRSVFVDLSAPSRMIVADTNRSLFSPNGVVEEFCARVLSDENLEELLVKNVRFYRPTLSDVDVGNVGVVVGGTLKISDDMNDGPVAIQYVHEGSGAQSLFTSAGEYYFGRVPQAGLYRINVFAQGCGQSHGQGLVANVENNNLGLDLELQHCSLSHSR